MHTFTDSELAAHDAEVLEKAAQAVEGMRSWGGEYVLTEGGGYYRPPGAEDIAARIRAMKPGGGEA